MFKITYQVRTYCEMQQMGWEEWQQAMQTAKEIVMKYRQMMAGAKLLTDESERKKAEKAAKAANLELDREKRENISTQLNQMSADMKITGSYAIDGKKLVLTSSDGVQELTILEDGKKTD